MIESETVSSPRSGLTEIVKWSCAVMIDADLLITFGIFLCFPEVDDLLVDKSM